MLIIEIESLQNGAHRNQGVNNANPDTFPVPDGWAFVPDDIQVPDTFPFVDITVDGQTVTSMTAGVVPEPEPEPEPEPTPTLEARVTSLEADKASQASVDELNEALDMILTGYTGEEAADEAGTA